MNRPVASKRHKLVGKLLGEIDFTKNMRCEEEVKVSTLVPDFPDNRKRIDWFVKDLKLVIEVHGEQHYKPVAFGNRPNAKGEFAKQVEHDIAKQAALENAGYFFLEIPYWDKLSADYLRDAILGCVGDGDELHPDICTGEHKLRVHPWASRSSRETDSKKSNWGKSRPIQSRGFRKNPFPKQKDPPLREWQQALLNLEKECDDQD